MTRYAKTEEALAALSDEEFYVTQKSGTERPGTGKYLSNKEPGIYVDVVSAMAAVGARSAAARVP